MEDTSVGEAEVLESEGSEQEEGELLAEAE